MKAEDIERLSALFGLFLMRGEGLVALDKMIEARERAAFEAARHWYNVGHYLYQTFEDYQREEAKRK